MNIDFSAFPYDRVVSWVVIGLGILVVVLVIRFFWQHILKFLFQGCLVILAILALLALLRYLKVF